MPKEMDWKLDVVSSIKTTYRNYIYFHRGYNTKKLIHRRSDKNINAELGNKM